MTFGSRSRRVASGLAFGALAVLTGCHAMPVGNLAPSPNRPQSTLATAGRAALLPATVAMDPPSEMSSIEPVTTPSSSITPVKPAATPLLDAALLRAGGLDELPTGKMAPEGPATLPETSTTIPPVTFPTLPAHPPTVEPTVPVPSPTVAAPPTPEPVKEPEPARPEDLWRDGVRQLIGLARARQESSAAGGSIANSPWSLRARVLAWLAEPDLDPDLGQREAEGVRAVLRALDESAGETLRKGDEVRSAVLVLEEKAPLEITDLRLCCKVDGFGDFEAFEPPVRKAGQPVILYCEVDGLRFEQTSAGFRTRVSAQFEILAEGGSTPLHSRTLGAAEETCRRRRRDYYLPCKFFLPRPIEPGDYRIRLTVKDLTSDRTASREMSFAIAKD